MTPAPRIVALGPGQGELWATVEYPDGHRVDRPVAEVETDLLLELVRDPEMPRLVLASVVDAHKPRTVGDLGRMIAGWLDGAVGAAAPPPTRAAEGASIIEEIQAAGRAKVGEWLTQLNDIVTRSGRLRDRFLAEHNDPRSLPPDLRTRLAVWAGEAETRRLNAKKVSDWLYEVSRIVDYHDHDVTRDRGAVGAVPAVIVVPIAIAAILGGIGLAAWIMRENRLEREHAAVLDLFRQNRELLAKCKTPQECKAAEVALGMSRDIAVAHANRGDDDGFPWAMAIGGLVALFLGVTVLRGGRNG